MDGGNTESGSTVDWKMIFAYVCFALGGALLLFGFVRICYYLIQTSKKKNTSDSNKDLIRNYYNSPWLKGNTFATAQRQNSTRERDDDVLRGVDVNSFYAMPDDSPKNENNHRKGTPPSNDDSEHSQTESQIYSSHRRLDQENYEPIYAVPHNGTINADDIDARAHYMEPYKPTLSEYSSSGSALQTLQIPSQRLNDNKNSYDNNSYDHNESYNPGTSTYAQDTQLVLSTLDAAVDGYLVDSRPSSRAGTLPQRAKVYLDRTLAEEQEIEYSFSSSVYVHSK